MNDFAIIITSLGKKILEFTHRENPPFFFLYYFYNFAVNNLITDKRKNTFL